MDSERYRAVRRNDRSRPTAATSGDRLPGRSPPTILVEAWIG
jgi:hypothetical protein